MNSLRDDLQPCGAMQEYLVTKIAADMWVLRRRYRAEAGAGKDIGSTAERELRIRRLQEIQEALSRVTNPVRYTRDWMGNHDDIENLSDVSAEGAAELRSWADGLQWILTFLEGLHKLVEDSNRIPESEWQILLGLYADDISLLGKWCRPRAMSPEPSMDPDVRVLAQRYRTHGYVLDDGEAKELLRLLRAEIALLGKQIPERKTEEAALTASRIGPQALPDDAFLDRILRYEKTVSNDMYRALKELRALQKDQRPEPVTVDGEADTDDSDAFRNW